MPSFDVVSKIDLQEVDNAVNTVLREMCCISGESRYNGLMNTRGRHFNFIHYIF